MNKCSYELYKKRNVYSTLLFRIIVRINEDMQPINKEIAALTMEDPGPIVDIIPNTPYEDIEKVLTPLIPEYNPAMKHPINVAIKDFLFFKTWPNNAGSLVPEINEVMAAAKVSEFLFIRYRPNVEKPNTQFHITLEKKTIGSTPEAANINIIVKLMPPSPVNTKNGIRMHKIAFPNGPSFLKNKIMFASLSEMITPSGPIAQKEIGTMITIESNGTNNGFKFSCITLSKKP